ncbi:hypothetical protein ZEAMMB73_Zm00001d015713 [Zea mays]|uniref:Uncharacterized protein n=1 Tax=Zea mays TaxID=4577 RepID=A0A1D6H3C7_MAIZE|nr:hypothetical protein ZEAMMB73_Zm00001d015713 [Zea mays]
MLLFRAAQMVLPFISNFHSMAWLSVVAAVMSFTYATIGLGLGLAKTIVHKGKMILADDTCKILEILADEYWNNHLARNDSVIVDTCHVSRRLGSRLKTSSAVISDVKCDNPKEEGKVQQTKRCEM